MAPLNSGLIAPKTLASLKFEIFYFAHCRNSAQISQKSKTMRIFNRMGLHGILSQRFIAYACLGRDKKIEPS